MVRCGDQLQCPVCTDKHIKVVINIPGKCDVCWPCDLLECHEGLGSTVACGSTVSVPDTDIDCVACVSGTNFSVTFGSEQCQPCGTCTDKNEHVLANCTPKHNVKCECNDGFYRNRTTKECLPCGLCCSDDGEIAKRCQHEYEIEKKCKFKGSWPQTCLSLSSTINPNVSSSVIVDNTLIKEKKGHSHKVVNISISLSLAFVFSLIVGYGLKNCFMKYRFKKSTSVSQHNTEKKCSDPEEGAERNEPKSRVGDSVSPLPLKSDPSKDPLGTLSVVLENVEATHGSPVFTKKGSSNQQGGKVINGHIGKGKSRSQGRA